MGAYHDSFRPADKAMESAFIAVLAAGGAGWLGWKLSWPWILDLDHPDFNPLVLLEGLLIGVALYQAGKALRWFLRARRFGTADLHLAGQSPAPMGGALRGEVRLGRPVAVEGDWTVTLTCFDLHESGDSDSDGGRTARDSFPVWSRSQTVAAGDGPTRAVAFDFTLPGSVGPKPQSRSRPGASLRASVHLPGFKRGIAVNAPPVARYWVLRLSAPTRGADFQAEFTVPVQD
ncbi:hypothetical protein [Gemmobacter caeruleus]|uniref:hypothetical protein n=1 Tax=Gemmobacter caeruleus TaxID=2595004 RepID=UPI0011EFC300|nr:hypothetical protein [Gemmobacter caeruleus]